MNIIKKNDKQINEVISKIIDRNDKLKTGYAAAKINDIYRASMGEVVSKYTKSVKLRRSTLFLEITSAPLKNELMHSSAQLISFINQELGSEVVSKIVIR